MVFATIYKTTIKHKPLTLYLQVLTHQLFTLFHLFLWNKVALHSIFLFIKGLWMIGVVVEAHDLQVSSQQRHHFLDGHHLDHLPFKETKSATLSKVQRFAEPLMWYFFCLLSNHGNRIIIALWCGLCNYLQKAKFSSNPSLSTLTLQKIEAWRAHIRRYKGKKNQYLFARILV